MHSTTTMNCKSFNIHAMFPNAETNLTYIMKEIRKTHKFIINDEFTTVKNIIKGYF